MNQEFPPQAYDLDAELAALTANFDFDAEQRNPDAAPIAGEMTADYVDEAVAQLYGDAPLSDADESFLSVSARSTFSDTERAEQRQYNQMFFMMTGQRILEDMIRHEEDEEKEDTLV